MEEDIAQDSETATETQIVNSDAENPDAENHNNANVSSESDTSSDAKHPQAINPPRPVFRR